MIAAVTPQVWWYVARSSGVVTLLVGAAAVGWGLALSAGLVKRRGVPAWLLDLHRHLGALAAAFLAVHLLALWADGYVHFAWRELFVPMASTWRPGGVTWGLIAMYSLAVVDLTSWAMRRLPRRLWRRVHLLSGVVVVTGTVHALTAGTDHANAFVQWLVFAAAVTLAFLILFRALTAGSGPARA